MRLLIAFCLLLGWFTDRAESEIRLPHLFSQHGVLQRDRPIHVWGWASPGSMLTVQFHTQKVQARANDQGAWSAVLEPESAGGPYSLTVDGDGRVTVDDLLVGDVWIASGQSNMEIPLKGFTATTRIKNDKEEIAAAAHPEIRLLLEERKSSDFPVDDIQGTWSRCTPETAANFSAVAYFFGRDLQEKQHVPIGILDVTWGGTPADAWVSLDTLGRDPQLLPAFRARAAFAAKQAEVGAQLAVERREDAAAKAAGRFAPQHVWRPFEESWIPAALFNGMIAPLTGTSVRGFIWYQGESNSSTDRAEDYATLFPALISDWRMHFGQGDLPFLFVQISSANAPGEHWGMVRDAQRRALSLRNTAMAVSLDVGDADNVHPPDKQTVGHRLTLAAQAVAYGEQVAYQSPLVLEVTAQPGALRVWFDHAEGLTSRGKPLDGFEIAGQDHHFVPATAKLEGSSVVVTSSAIGTPRYVRYLWQNFPPAPLYNAAGLPASTFTSEWFPTLEH